MSASQTLFDGRVQGVGFRYTCKDLARGFDLSGNVKNLPDGTVRLILQGEQEEIEAYLHDLTEESVVADHIKSRLTTSIDPDPSLRGFTILR